jgi:hypothetical protein
VSGRGITRNLLGVQARMLGTGQQDHGNVLEGQANMLGADQQDHGNVLGCQANMLGTDQQDHGNVMIVTGRQVIGNVLGGGQPRC